MKQAQAMTPEILAAMSGLVNLNDAVQFAAWIAILTGFYLLFWKSNLVPDTCIGFDPTKQLVRQNLIRLKDCYIAQVFWSKTIQFQDRYLDIPMLPNVDKRLCPVFWLDLYLSNVPAGPMDPAYLVQQGVPNCSLSYAQLTYWLHEWVNALGLDGGAFSSHSLHRGGPNGWPNVASQPT